MLRARDVSIVHVCWRSMLAHHGCPSRPHKLSVGRKHGVASTRLAAAAARHAFSAAIGHASVLLRPPRRHATYVARGGEARAGGAAPAPRAWRTVNGRQPRRLLRRQAARRGHRTCAVGKRHAHRPRVRAKLDACLLTQCSRAALMQPCRPRAAVMRLAAATRLRGRNNPLRVLCAAR